MESHPPPVGVLIVRAWVEERGPTGLRAVVSSSLDVTFGQRSVTHAGSIPDVVATVETWLDALVSDRLGEGPPPR